MNAAPLTDLSRLCIHTITTKPWDIETAARKYSAAGVAGITVWRDALENRDAADTGRMLRDEGLSIVSLCRGGFFPSPDRSARARTLDDNRRALDDAAALGAPLLVLVCGSSPAQPLAESRRQIQDGIAAILPHARERRVKLAIEPLHPMYADTRSAINTLGQANDMAESLQDPCVGVAVDVYHLWWDPHLPNEIARCGSHDNLLAFHVCDWNVPTNDLLLDRALMGEGCINVPAIRGWVENAGFGGFVEVEIFSQRHWTRDQDSFLNDITHAFLHHT